MRRSLALPALALALVLGAPAAALADLPPPNSTECNGKNPGDTCMDDMNRPGTCTASSCSKYNPADGGTSQYVCVLCIAPDGGTSAGSSSSSSSGGKGCAVTGAPPAASWWPALALALPLLRRRRR
jgi:MYXO-CTERM domain-containing protein